MLRADILARLYIKHAKVLQETAPAVTLLVAHHLRTQIERFSVSAKALVLSVPSLLCIGRSKNEESDRVASAQQQDSAELLALRIFLASTGETTGQQM